MTVTATTFKARFTVFSAVTDDVVEDAIDEASRWVSVTAYGSQDRADDAIRYLTGHLLSLDAALNGAGSTAGSASAGPSGPIASMGGLSASVSYAIPTNASDDWFATTAWGRRFLSIERRVFAPRTI